MTDTTASGLTADEMVGTLTTWDTACHAPVHLIACSHAALTLLKFRAATQEIDLIVPLQPEYDHLLSLLPTIGFTPFPPGFRTDAAPGVLWRFWPGDSAFGARLPESPLASHNSTNLSNRHWRHISLSILNLKDLIITNIFRGRPADIADCIALFKTWKVDAEELLERYAHASKYAEQPDEMMRRFMDFVEQLASQELVSDDVWQRISHATA